jgi:predicted ATPase
MAWLAELEAEGGKADEALIRIDEALAQVQQTGEHRHDAILHRIRGNILLKLDPARPEGVEEAYRTAIAIAQQQKTRSFELQAALALARLYRSFNRGVDALAVLAPALQGISPSPELCEISDAQALITTLVS